MRVRPPAWAASSAGPGPCGGRGRGRVDFTALDTAATLTAVESAAANVTELHECRQCCAFCDRVVHPAGCIESGCAYLYLFDEEETGRRYMGCMNKVFRAEIDVEAFESAQRTRHGFGGVKMTGLPLSQCRSSVERAYDGYGDPFDCVNPEFFDLRDSL